MFGRKQNNTVIYNGVETPKPTVDADLERVRAEGTIKGLERQVKELQKSVDILEALTELEPGLKKYRLTLENFFSGGEYEEWDLEGMKTAIEFRKGEDLARKYATSRPAVKP